MKDRKLSESPVVELGRASVETKGGGIVFPDASGGLRNVAPGIVDD
jgi:hypothetical protein